MNIIGLVIAIIGLPASVFFIIIKFRKRYKYDFDYKNIIIAKQDGRLCFLILELNILNNSDKTRTFKSINLSYKYENKKYLEESFVVLTGTSANKEGPILYIQSGINKIFVAPWENIRIKLGEKKAFSPGEVFSGSALYLLDNHVSNAHRLEKVKLVVKDYSGTKTVQNINIKEEFFIALESGSVVINRKWKQSEDGKIELL